MKYLKISIVTPTLNQGQFIERTIDSVLSQEYPNYEYIIVDGGSTDNTVEIIKKYEKHLKFWISEKDNGQSDAVNKGVNYVSGDLFNWINSDDYYTPNALNIVNHYFQDNNVDILCARSRIFNTQNQSRKSKGTFVDPKNLSKTIGMAIIDQPATFFRTSVFLNLAPLNNWLHYVMDRELWIRYLIKNGNEKIKKIDEELVHFRIHEESKTGKMSENFNQERNGLFYHLALKLDDVPIAEFLRKNYQTEDSYDFLGSVVVDHEHRQLVREALNYFLMQLMEEAYWIKNYSLANKIHKKINFKSLAPADRQLLTKIYLKNNCRKLMQSLR